MDSIKRLGVITILGLGLFTGCGKGDTAGTTAATTTEAAPTIQETDPNSSPVARAAYDFLDAVLKGDSQRASARMTPQAMQRITSSGMTFSLPGLETCKFKLGAIVNPSAEQAIVQCVLTDIVEGKPHSEEMCCLLRMVENDWRISGIAYGTAPNMPWTLTDFETGKNMSIPRQTMGGMAGNQPNGGQQPNAGVQANTPVPTPPAPLGPPAVGPANVNSPAAGTAGLGMPAVGPSAPGQQQPQPQYQAPYTAQDPQGPIPR